MPSMVRIHHLPPAFARSAAESEGCRAKVQRSGRRRTGVVANVRILTSKQLLHFFDCRFTIWTLMATNSAESKVKHEVKKERGRTLLQPLNENKALKLTIRSCATTNFLLDAAPQTTPYLTHGTLRFCIPTMELRYQTPRLLLVTSSGYTQNLENKGKPLKLGQRRRNLATASVRVRTCSFS